MCSVSAVRRTAKAEDKAAAEISADSASVGNQFFEFSAMSCLIASTSEGLLKTAGKLAIKKASCNASVLVMSAFWLAVEG